MKRACCSKRKQRSLDVTRLLARDGRNCSICEMPMDRKIRDPLDGAYITFDHIIPRSLGGSDLLLNKRLAHRICNEDRGNDPVVEDES